MNSMRSDVGGLLSAFLTFVIARPGLSFCYCCILILSYTRVRSGFFKSRRQRDRDNLEKKVPIVPYWLPYLGHTPSLAWSFDDLLAKGRDTTSDGIFGLNILGTTHHMALVPSLVKQIFLQRPSVLSGDDFLYWISERYFGDEGASRRTNPDEFHTLHRTFNSLMSEPFLSNATAKTTKLVEERTIEALSFSSESSENTELERLAKVTYKDSYATADLYMVLMKFIGDLTGEVLMGKAFIEDNPGILEDLWVFDGGFTMLFSGLAGLTSRGREAKAARDRLNKAVGSWNHLAIENSNNRYEDISETMKLRLKALVAMKAEDSFAAVSNLAIYWGLMVNANKVIFWMLLSIVSSPQLLSTIREEMKPFASIKSDHSSLKLDVDGLCKSCPILKATFFETLRLYVAGTTYKKVLKDLVLKESPEDAATLGKPIPQKYRIPAGTYLAIPHATMQMDPRLWNDPSTFDPYRFVISDEKDPEKVRVGTRHLNAFGGGPSICKGRYFAEREVLLFVAGFLTAYDFESVEEKWKMPDKFYVGTGTADPKGPVFVKMKRRC